MERIVDVTEQLVPDYDYEKLSEEYAGFPFRGLYRADGAKAAGCAHEKGDWSTVSMHCWDINYRKRESIFTKSG